MFNHSTTVCRMQDQTALRYCLQLVFQKFKKSFKVVFVYPFVANSFPIC